MTHTSGSPFSVVRAREAYAINEVDAFLEEVERELQGPLPSPALSRRIQEVRFTQTRLVGGYDMNEVDDHLDELALRAETGTITEPKYVPSAVSTTHQPPPRSLTTSRFGSRYVTSEVDDFLAQMDTALARRLPDESLARYISEVRFTPLTGLGRGYDKREVDERLDVLHQWALTGRRPT